MKINFKLIKISSLQIKYTKTENNLTQEMMSLACMIQPVSVTGPLKPVSSAGQVADSVFTSTS